MLRSRKRVQLFVRGQGLEAADHLVLQQLLLISGGSTNHHADILQSLNGTEPWCRLLKSLVAAHELQSVSVDEAEALHGCVKAVQKEAAPGRARSSDEPDERLSERLLSTELPVLNQDKLACQRPGEHMNLDEDELDQQELQVSEQMLYHADVQHTQDLYPALHAGESSRQADSAAAASENFVPETGSHDKARRMDASGGKATDLTGAQTHQQLAGPEAATAPTKASRKKKKNKKTQKLQHGMTDCSVPAQLPAEDAASAQQELLLEARARQGPDPVQGMTGFDKTAGPSLGLATSEGSAGPLSSTSSSPPTEATPPGTRELSHPPPVTSELASKPSGLTFAGVRNAEYGAPAKPTAVKPMADPECLVPGAAAPKVTDPSAGLTAVRPVLLSPELAPAKGNELVCAASTVSSLSLAFRSCCFVKQCNCNPDARLTCQARPQTAQRC